MQAYIKDVILERSSKTSVMIIAKVNFTANYAQCLDICSTIGLALFGGQSGEVGINEVDSEVDNDKGWFWLNGESCYMDQDYLDELFKGDIEETQDARINKDFNGLSFKELDIELEQQSE